jgi:hypothetical protein
MTLMQIRLLAGARRQIRRIASSSSNLNEALGENLG